MTATGVRVGPSDQGSGPLRAPTPTREVLVQAPKGLVPGVGFVADCEVLVRGADIAWVGHRDAAGARPDTSGAEVVAFPGGTVLPGLVDPHVHLSFSGTGDVVATLTDESDLAQLARSTGNAQLGLRRGVTTQVDCGSRGVGLLALRDAIAAGLLQGPRLLVAGAPITTTAGHCHWLGGCADSPDEVVRAVRTRVAEGADIVKVMLTGGNMTRGSNPGALQFSPQVMAAVGEEAARLGKPLVVHAHCEEAVLVAARSGAAVIAHATCTHGPGTRPAESTLEELAGSGAHVDPTLMVGKAPAGAADREPWTTAEHHARTRLRQSMIPVLQDMARRGIPLVAGTDGGSTNVAHGQAAGAIQALHAEVGLAPEAALLAGTDVPARAYGIRQLTGALEAGLSADLLVVAGDAEADLAALDAPLAVWARGSRVVGVGPTAE